MKKTRKRLALDKHTLRDLTASEPAQVVGGVITGVCSSQFCPTQQVCPTRVCTLYPGCPN